MSNKTGRVAPIKGSKQKPSSRPSQKGKDRSEFQVREIHPGELAAIVLEELSRTYPSHANYLEAASLARSGEIYLALMAVQDSNRRLAGTYDAERIWVQAQSTAVLKKLVDREIDRWPATKQRWFATERRMELMNRKFEALARRRVLGNKDLPFSKELYRFYEALIWVLGDSPDVKEIAELAHYGPGSTVSVRGSHVHYARKLEAGECVPDCVPLAVEALMLDKAIWEQHGLRPEYAHLPDARSGFRRILTGILLQQVTTCDRLMFIHKNIEELRSIGAQPTVSGMLQLGIHTYGCELLLKCKVDLRDQDWNRRLAKEGSLHWDSENPFCTLDKSNASNMHAVNLVRYWFPPAWAKVLLSTRSPEYEAPPELGGSIHKYQMYAGMGNGTTFFVETLVFWAATYATQDLPIDQYVLNHEYAVYGDDVILRRDHAQRYMRFARFLGFQFNAKKTFLDGPFRESCGADYYKGINVRPAYIDTERVGMSDLIGLHNTLADHPHFKLNGALKRIRSLWRGRVFPIVPTDPSGDAGFRPFGSDYYDIVKTKTGLPVLSSWWQRPRTYYLDKKPVFGDLPKDIGTYTQMAVAILRARQQGTLTGSIWSLPVRDLETIRVVAEKDLVKKDLVQMLGNQLARLAEYKAQPWWKSSRGL